MLRQAENNVRIEGILSEINLEKSSYDDNNNKRHDIIKGSVTVKVDKEVQGQMQTLYIPVHVFANKQTKTGKINPAYESAERIMDSYVSIAAADEARADKIRIEKGNISMNEYWGQNGQLVSFPRIRASFFKKVTSDFKPDATFSTEFVIASKVDEVDNKGELTGRLIVKGILPQYDGKVDVVNFIVENANAIDYINMNWAEGDTVCAHGRLFFSQRTETTLVEVDFGEPIEQSKTIKVSDLIITGSKSNMNDASAYDATEIQQALSVRTAELEKKKEKDMSKTRQAQAPTADSSNLGF